MGRSGEVRPLEQTPCSSGFFTALKMQNGFKCENKCNFHTGRHIGVEYNVYYELAPIMLSSIRRG